MGETAQGELDRTKSALAQAQAQLAAAKQGQVDEAELQRRLAAAIADRLAAQKAAETQMTEAQRQATLLAQAQATLADRQAKSTEDARSIEALNQQVAALRQQVAGLQSVLGEAKEKDKASDVRIQSLGSDLNAALARAAIAEQKLRQAQEAEVKRLAAENQNLEKYRSEFFGRLREVLGDREGVKIVGDRFVFSSEVLFPTGSATLSDGGKAQIARVKAILDEVKDQIPPGIDWIIRVDGHTDDVPITGGAFADNWELSQARALSVVEFMIDDLGFPPGRLAATGFGQWQPVNPADTPEARAQNRRIELKLTER